MKGRDIRRITLQRLARGYMKRMAHVAGKHGQGEWLRATLEANRKGQCEATRKEVDLLARMCNDDRIARTDIPRTLGMSYRRCNDKGLFDRIRTLGHVGIYSKVDTMIEKAKKDESEMCEK